MVTRNSIWMIIFAIAIAGLLLLIPSQPAIIVVAQPEIPEGWIEIINERTRVGKKYVNISNPSQESITTGLATIHYESIMDTGIYDSECDFSSQRINNAQLDGWRVTQCGWHYALGQPSGKTTDGWIGFGGRQGSNWIMFRLSRVGYLHWPTRNWEDIGGLPIYDRLDLVSEVGQSEYGYGNMVNVSATTTWSNIWTTPDNGALNITWQASGDRLKEEIIINQAAREWLQTNRPPSTPASETWFGFVLQVDWTDIPKVIKDGLEQNINGDWNVTNTPIELRDNLDRLLAFMPISEVIVRDELTEIREPLTKRFWLDGDGNHYVLMGIRIPKLMNMPIGDLIFDPTIDEQVGAGADDTTRHAPTAWSNSYAVAWGPGNHSGESFPNRHQSFRFTSVTIPDSVTVTAADFEPYMAVIATDGAQKTNIHLEDANNPLAPTSYSDFDARSLTTAFTAWDNVDYSEGFINSPDISSVAQEVLDRGDWDSGDSMQIFWQDDFSAPDNYAYVDMYDGSPSRGAQLHITYSTGEPTIDFSYRQCEGPLNDVNNTMYFNSSYSTIYNIIAKCNEIGTFYTGATDWTKLNTTTYDFHVMLDRFYGNGTLINIYRLASAHVDDNASLVIQYSEDGGITWTDPRIIYNSSFDDRANSGGIAFDDSIIVALTRYNATTSTYLDWGWIRSTDGGATWSSYTTFPAWSGDVTQGNHHGPLIKLDNGTIGLTYYEFHNANNIGRIIIRWSDNYGATWTRNVTAHPNDGLQVVEPNGIYMGNGRLWIIFADFDDSTNNFYQVTSTDYGITWTTRVATGSALDTGSSGHGPWTYRQYDKIVILYRGFGANTKPAHAWANISDIMEDASAWEDNGELSDDIGVGYGSIIAVDNGSMLFVYSFRENVVLEDEDQDLHFAWANPAGMALRLTNTGDTAMNITLNLTTDPPSGITLKWNDSSHSPLIGQNTINSTLTPQVCTNISVGNACFVWLWKDFQGTNNGTFTTNLTVSSFEFDTGISGTTANLPLSCTVSLWVNSPPSITNKIASDSGNSNTAYSRSFTATDTDSNQTLIWTLVTNASFLSIDSLNRTVYINGTLPSSGGSFYVNVTVGDGGPTNLTDYVNYTLTVIEIEIPTALTHSEWIQIILIGVMFMFLTALAFAHNNAWPLFFVAGLIGIVYGVWLTGFLVAPLMGLTFIFPSIIVMVYGGFRLKEAF